MTRNLMISGLRLLEEDGGSGFHGEHDESYGSKYDAMFGSSERFLTGFLVKIVRDGKISFKQKISDSETYYGIAFPEKSPVSVLSLLIEKDGKNEWFSACPLLMGIDNDLKLKEIYTWKSSAEGEMAAAAPSGDLVAFHDPFFILDKDFFKAGQIQTVSLAALAFSLQKLDEAEFAIECGDAYEEFLNEFLEENPGKTKEDFIPPVYKVDADYFRMFFPREVACVYEAAGQVKEVEFLKCFETRYAVLKVELGQSDEENPLCCRVYASEYVLKDYVPGVGDGISGIFWMTGFFH